MDACLDVRAVHAEPIAAEYDVAFSFVVHNGAVYLDKSLGELVSIGRRFRRFWIFYVENDSTDGTQLILTKFGAAHPDTVHGEMLRNFANSSLSLCRSAKHRNCAARVALLAALRQRAFDNALRSHSTWRVLIVVDMDWVELTVSALLQAFALGVERKASAVFALSVYRNSEVPVPRHVPYDRASAVLDAQPAFERGRYLTSPRFWYAVQDNVQCVVRVKSAFGGVGIYITRCAPSPQRSSRGTPELAITIKFRSTCTSTSSSLTCIELCCHHTVACTWIHDSGLCMVGVTGHHPCTAWVDSVRVLIQCPCRHRRHGRQQAFRIE